MGTSTSSNGKCEIIIDRRYDRLNEFQKNKQILIDNGNLSTLDKVSDDIFHHSGVTTRMNCGLQFTTTTMRMFFHCYCTCMFGSCVCVCCVSGLLIT